jgi:hypothetical protein
LDTSLASSTIADQYSHLSPPPAPRACSLQVLAQVLRHGPAQHLLNAVMSLPPLKPSLSSLPLLLTYG